MLEPVRLALWLEACPQGSSAASTTGAQAVRFQRANLAAVVPYLAQLQTRLTSHSQTRNTVHYKNFTLSTGSTRGKEGSREGAEERHLLRALHSGSREFTCSSPFLKYGSSIAVLACVELS